MTQAPHWRVEDGRDGSPIAPAGVTVAPGAGWAEEVLADPEVKRVYLGDSFD